MSKCELSLKVLQIANFSQGVLSNMLFTYFSGDHTMAVVLFTYETGSCNTTVQFWQKVHGVDITHDNVCSSMLSCFYSYVAATINRASYF